LRIVGARVDLLGVGARVEYVLSRRGERVKRERLERLRGDG
jgi:hypothetical protein